ncbi:DNA-directed DNA polymerase epsilon, subunit B [Lignoscripta atroalba]|nr:DNA-directed DNA polymerase epsilon, subunit B [Lignoscripta atroalba]
MNGQTHSTSTRAVPLLQSAPIPAVQNTIPSSSPAFGTPVHPIRPQHPPGQLKKPSVLPILLPPATLRPLAFRTFTKKHNLTLTSSALQALATFIGKQCGSGWREEGLAEKVLEEVAKTWKKNGGGVIVEGDSVDIKTILRNLESCISGGRIVHRGGLSRQGTFASRTAALVEQPSFEEARPSGLGREDSQASLGLSNLEVADDEENNQTTDPRAWLKVIGSFEQPRLVYNLVKRQFEKAVTRPSLLPDPSHKTQLFRHRYNLIHQRLLRNESFQTPTIAPDRTTSLQRSSSTIATVQQIYKLTPIANLLGRSGSSHLLLGLLAISPTGTLAISDLTGSIALDLRHARPIPEHGAWFAPGMIVLVDGIYEEEGSSGGPGLGGGGGVGGTIGGKFVGFSVGGPPCERREVTLGVSGFNGEGDSTAGGGFGWVDFLGVGSERASGIGMRRLEKNILRRSTSQYTHAGRSRVVIMGEVNLDNAKTIQALQKILGIYAAEPANQTPMIFVLIGNFVRYALMAGGSGGSIEYKEYFDSLASALSDYPTVLRAATFIFVPGDNDPWPSCFSAGAATILPRKAVPDLFTSRIKRAFAAANADAEKMTGKRVDGEAIWTTNPARLSLFGPAHEVVIFRDDVSGRLRRTAIGFQSVGTFDTNKPRNQGTHTEAGDNVLEPNEHMDVDEAVEAAESHIPAVKEQDSVKAAAPSDMPTARKLVKTILDQGYLAPFPLSNRPVLWDFASALQLYPLPTSLILMDPEAPSFAVTYEGCHVMNPGRLVAEGRRGLARWMEYDAGTRRGKTREATF